MCIQCYLQNKNLHLTFVHPTSQDDSLPVKHAYKRARHMHTCVHERVSFPLQPSKWNLTALAGIIPMIDVHFG